MLRRAGVLAAALAILTVGASGCGGGLKNAVDSARSIQEQGKSAAAQAEQQAQSVENQLTQQARRARAAAEQLRLLGARTGLAAGREGDERADLALTGRSAGDLLLLDRSDALDVVLVVHDAGLERRRLLGQHRVAG